ncbi:MAG: hypothetical protein Q4B60_03105 [Erysipelotrichaceae bacterium]|nr:hypothetical protein [Erysipelotrichaceae bacterium]
MSKKHFLNTCKPGEGRITYDQNYDIKSHKHEIETAKWIVRKFGGHIHLMTEDKSKDHEKISNPDYLWRGKWWELKGTKSVSGISKRLEIAISQINNNPIFKAGGIIIDVTGTKLNKNDITAVTRRRLSESTKANMIVIIKKEDEVIDVISSKKKK